MTGCLALRPRWFVVPHAPIDSANPKRPAVSRSSIPLNLVSQETRSDRSAQRLVRPEWRDELRAEADRRREVVRREDLERREEEVARARVERARCMLARREVIRRRELVLVVALVFITWQAHSLLRLSQAGVRLPPWQYVAKNEIHNKASRECVRADVDGRLTPAHSHR